MMDSQENILQQEETKEVIQEATAPEVVNEEVAPAAEQVASPVEEVALAAEEVAPVAEEAPRKVYETKAEVLKRLQDIAHGDETPQKDEVDYLKTAFYKLHIAEREAKLKGPEPAAFHSICQ